jgi:hypothetical protein
MVQHNQQLAGANHMSRPVDLTQLPTILWAWVYEHLSAAIRGCSMKGSLNTRQAFMAVI